jgi:hypothetical protein
MARRRWRRRAMVRGSKGRAALPGVQEGRPAPSRLAGGGKPSGGG